MDDRVIRIPSATSWALKSTESPQESKIMANGTIAMRWLSSVGDMVNFYKFQQLRDQNYAFAICLGISPFDAHCWVLPKSIIMKRWDSKDIRPQHGGQQGRDTAWLTVKPNAVLPWLDEYGGSLSDAVNAITRITGQVPSQ